MSSKLFEAFLAKIYVDAKARTRFLSDPLGEAQRAGLSPEEALDFQKAVDKLFSFGGFRGEESENPVHLARNFRRLAGFTDDEIGELVDIAAEAYAEAQARSEAALTA